VAGAGDPAADDDPAADPDADAEHPGSAATTHRDAAAMTDSLAGIRRGRPIP
jgi:hypothetical protein